MREKNWGSRQKRSGILMHREILNTPKGFYTDHENGNKLDNRKKNLRIATKSLNGANREKPKNNTSGYKGVSWHNRDKRWRVNLQLNGKGLYLGNYKDREEAARRYDETASKYFGAFAKLNFIQ